MKYHISLSPRVTNRSKERTASMGPGAGTVESPIFEALALLCLFLSPELRSGPVPVVRPSVVDSPKSLISWVDVVLVG